MKSVLIDSDVILDVILERESFVEVSREVVVWAQLHAHRAIVAYHTVANLHYISRKELGKDGTLKIIRELLRFIRVEGASSSHILKVMEFAFADFEDALQAAVATACGSDYIVTRNLKHYKKSPVKAVSPAQFLAMQ